MKNNKRALYEHIMSKVSLNLKSALNEMDGYKRPLDPNKTYRLFARLGAFVELSGKQLQRIIDGGGLLTEEELNNAFVCFASDSYIPQPVIEDELYSKGYDVPNDELDIAH